MPLVTSTQRSSAMTAAIASSVAVVSICAATAGPFNHSSAWQLAASSLPAEVAAAVHDVLEATRAAVHADRAEIVAGRAPTTPVGELLIEPAPAVRLGDSATEALIVLLLQCGKDPAKEFASELFNRAEQL